MDLKATHIMLVKGDDLKSCQQRVLHFFSSNLLIRYNEVIIDDAGSYSAETETFWDLVTKGTERNRQVAAGLIADLQEAGFKTLNELNTMEQGYKSKLLHTLTHLLDGFFGIDTFFYNLEEDSHWLSDELASTMKSQPEKFWLLQAKCSSESDSTDFLERIRSSGSESQ